MLNAKNASENRAELLPIGIVQINLFNEAGQPINDTDKNQSELYAESLQETIGSAVQTAAPVLIPAGEFMMDVAENLDSPWVKYSLMAFDIALGPVKFLANEVVQRSPVGEYI